MHLSSVPDPVHHDPVPDDAATTDLSRLETDLREARLKIENLEMALTTCRVISTGVGVLMATFKVTYDAAFDMLVVASQNTHRKLRDIAAEVVETGTLNWGRDMVPQHAPPVSTTHSTSPSAAPGADRSAASDVPQVA